MNIVDAEALYDAAEQLALSETGLQALRHLLAFLDGPGLSLDEKNINACVTLLTGAWGQYPGTARDFMREKIE